jgi:hypothetical protein
MFATPVRRTSAQPAEAHGRHAPRGDLRSAAGVARTTSTLRGGHSGRTSAHAAPGFRYRPSPTPPPSTLPSDRRGLGHSDAARRQLGGARPIHTPSQKQHGIGVRVWGVGRTTASRCTIDESKLERRDFFLPGGGAQNKTSNTNKQTRRVHLRLSDALPDPVAKFLESRGKISTRSSARRAIAGSAQGRQRCFQGRAGVGAAGQAKREAISYLPCRGWFDFGR